MKTKLIILGIIAIVFGILGVYSTYNQETDSNYKKISFGDCKEIGGEVIVIIDIYERNNARNDNNYLGDIFPSPQSPAVCMRK